MRHEIGLQRPTPWVSLGDSTAASPPFTAGRESGRRVRAKTIVSIAGDRRFESMISGSFITILGMLVFTVIVYSKV